MPARSSPQLSFMAWLASQLLLGLLVPASSGEALGAEDWADRRTIEPFVCRADFSLEGQEAFLQELAQLHGELVKTLGIKPTNEIIELYLFHDQRTYRAYLARYLPNVPFRRALYVRASGPGRVFAYVSPNFQIDVRHECTHAVLHTAVPEVPLWLDEGLAVYFEVPTNMRVSASPHMAELQMGARRGFVPDLTSLERRNELVQMGAYEYRDSWAWVHFMLNGPAEAHEELVKYLGDAPRQQASYPLSYRLRRRIPDLERRFIIHFAHHFSTLWRPEAETKHG